MKEIVQIFHDTPWKVWNEVWRLLCLPYVRLVFLLTGIQWGKRWKIYGVPIIQKHRGSSIIFGDDLELRSTVESNPLSPFHPVVISTRSAQAIMAVGHHFSMTGGSLVAARAITIGDHVTVGANSLIIDTDFHPLDPKKRRLNSSAGSAAPIVIKNDVFIGTQSIVLKGITIGVGAIVGAGTVVRHTVPANKIAT